MPDPHENSARLAAAHQAVAVDQDAREHPARSLRLPVGNTRLLLGVSLASFLVIGAILSLTLKSWWFLALALLAHAAGTAVVTLVTTNLIGQQDKPPAVEVARREARTSATDTDVEGNAG